MSENTFPLHCIPFLIPYTGISDFVKLRQLFLLTLGTEVLEYPHKVEVRSAKRGKNETVFLIRRSFDCLVENKEQKNVYSGFTKMFISSYCNWDVLKRNARHLTSLDLGQFTLAENPEIIFERLRHMRIWSWNQLAPLNGLMCPVIEDLHLLYPEAEDWKETMFLQKHKHLIKSLTISSDWFVKELPGLQTFHDFKSLLQLVVRVNSICPACSNGDGDLVYSAAKLILTEEEFQALPKSIQFRLEEEDIPEQICVYAESRIATPVLRFLKQPIKALQTETGFPLLTFITNDPTCRLIVRDDCVFQLNLGELDDVQSYLYFVGHPRYM